MANRSRSPWQGAVGEKGNTPCGAGRVEENVMMSEKTPLRITYVQGRAYPYGGPFVAVRHDQECEAERRVLRLMLEAGIPVIEIRIPFKQRGKGR